MNTPSRAILELPPAPLPREGAAGLLDRFIGPGASRAELMLQTMPSIAAALAVPLAAQIAGAEWSLPMTLVASFFALDLVGGVTTNATSAAKRWYHREGQGRRQHATFVLIHFVHIGLVAAVFDCPLRWAATAAIALVLAAGAVLAVPTYLQRPVAYTAYAATLILTLYGPVAPLGMEWFLPLFYLKLLVSHLPKEYPFAAPGVTS